MAAFVWSDWDSCEILGGGCIWLFFIGEGIDIGIDIGIAIAYPNGFFWLEDSLPGYIYDCFLLLLFGFDYETTPLILS